MKIPYERMSIIRNFEQRHRNNPRLEVEAGAEYSDVGGKKYTNFHLNELKSNNINVETLLASNPLQEIHSNYHQTPPSHTALNRRQKSHGGNSRITEKKYSCSKVRER